jgi:hypothetical protein
MNEKTTCIRKDVFGNCITQPDISSRSNIFDESLGIQNLLNHTSKKQPNEQIIPSDFDLSKLIPKLDPEDVIIQPQPQTQPQPQPQTHNHNHKLKLKLLINYFIPLDLSLKVKILLVMLKI